MASRIDFHFWSSNRAMMVNGSLRLQSPCTFELEGGSAMAICFEASLLYSVAVMLGFLSVDLSSWP